RLVRLTLRIQQDHSIRQGRSVPLGTYPFIGPIEVPVEPLPVTRPLKCYFNVRNVIAEQGGEALFGWSFYDDDDGMFFAQHHAIWQRDDQRLVDVTPNDLNAPSILFLADPRVPFDYVDLRMPSALNWCSRTGTEYWSGPEGKKKPF